MGSKFSYALACALLLLSVAGAAQAQIKYDPANYDALASADSSDTIAPGTRITLQNWQQYKKFMPIGVQAMFSQSYPFRVGSGPEFTMEVGPTVAIPMAAKLKEDTEKYAGQTKLRKVAGGGYTVDGYMAGVPFPKPSGDLTGVQVLYNAFFGFIPPIYRYTTNTSLIDRFHNIFPQYTEVIYWRLSHLSDPGMPINPDYGKDYLQSARYFVLSPEQTRYTTQLAQQPDDPEKVQEIYVFLPSLRRSLRLSSAARCSPILGTDWVQDDNSDGMAFQIPNFNVRFAGRKKLLFIVHASVPGMYDNQNYLLKSSVPAFPSAKVGKWELRDVMVVDTSPLPSMSGYCYGHKVGYIDPDTWTQVGWDFYDVNSKFWKFNMIPMTPLKIDTGDQTTFHSANVDIMWDFQNQHVTSSNVDSPPQFASKISADLRDASTWAFAGSLSRIMK
ncbi:MAG TPA: DUF1329 domain-containing protein [Candidatus Binataceae bacterium]|nr:DUF1329 domain-containing protein [Candidatus Binataceae bacterium]